MAEEKQAPPGPQTRPDDLNHNTEQFWKSRGYPARPPDWQTRDPRLPPDDPPQRKK